MKPLTGHKWLDMSAAVSLPGTFLPATDGSQYPSVIGASTVRCTIQPDNSSEAMEYQRLTGKVRATGYFDPKTTVGGATSITKDATLVVTEADGTVQRYRTTGPGYVAAGVHAHVVIVVPLEVLT